MSKIKFADWLALFFHSCERDRSGTTEATRASVAQPDGAKVMERIARRERGRSPREAARPNYSYNYYVSSVILFIFA
jgi:hypothetical protein